MVAGYNQLIYADEIAMPRTLKTLREEPIDP
jgi:hypothetical protein